MLQSKSHFKTFSISLAFVWLILFACLPNAMIFFTSFLSKDNQSLISLPFTLSHYERLFDPLYGKILWHSIELSTISTFICLLIGYPTAWMITHYGKLGRALILFMIIVPFWTNSLIRTYAIKIVLATKGALNNLLLFLGLIDEPIRMLYTEVAVIVGFVYILLPFMIFPLYIAIDKLPKNYHEAARDLGANRVQYFLKVMLPLTSSGIISGIVMVFLPAMGMFYLSDLLGGSKHLLVGNIIRDQILIARNWPFAASASVVLIIMMAFLMIFYFKADRNAVDKEKS